ncbi:hypothetical protein [Ktedonospora formicarum]|nr:hypothetical protein [Ktedonospora formicarum]
MNSSIRINALLVMLGGLAALICFLLLPFAMNPFYFRMDTAPGLLLLDGTRLTRYMQIPDLKYDGTFGAFIVSYGSMWAIPIISLIIAMLALVWILRRRPTPILPIFCSILSVILIIATLLTLDEFFVLAPGTLKSMFTPNPLFGSLVGPGWWVCMVGGLLALIAGILGLVGSLRRSRPGIV